MHQNNISSNTPDSFHFFLFLFLQATTGWPWSLFSFLLLPSLVSHLLRWFFGVQPLFSVFKVIKSLKVNLFPQGFRFESKNEFWCIRNEVWCIRNEFWGIINRFEAGHGNFQAGFEAGRLGFQASQGLARFTARPRGVGWVRQGTGMGLAFWNPRAFWGFFCFNLLLCSHFNFFHLICVRLRFGVAKENFWSASGP